jgi:hypothetical protein
VIQTNDGAKLYDYDMATEFELLLRTSVTQEYSIILLLYDFYRKLSRSESFVRLHLIYQEGQSGLSG